MVSKSTLPQLRFIWTKYSESVEPQNQQGFNKKFRDGWLKMRKSISERQHGLGQVNATGVRAAGPLSPISRAYAAELHYEKFWDTGVVGGNSSDLASAKNPNPTFLYTSFGDGFTAHEGTDPVLGFHMEMAYAEVLGDGPLGEVSKFSGSRARSRQQLMDHIARVAKGQFKEWSKAFVKMAKRKLLTVRFHLGDGLRFCRTMAICREKGVDASSFDYAQNWSAAPLKLDGGDYEGSSVSPAPMSFDVIETSNVSDHVGLLNLLIAATVVLSSKPSSTLYTETFHGSAANQLSELPHMLCGDVVTMSLLLGLTPVGYVTGTIPGSSAQENYGTGNRNDANHQHIRISWKQPVLGDEVASTSFGDLGEPRSRFDPKELATVLFKIYHKVFETESLPEWQKRYHQPLNQQLAVTSHRYIRETYAEFLKLVRKRVDTNWSDVIEILRGKIVMDQHLNLGVSNGGMGIMDLFFHLHQSGVDDMGKIDEQRPQNIYLPQFLPSKYQPGASSESTMPKTVTVVLTVPRSKLTPFTKTDPAKKGPSPTLCAAIGRPEAMHLFSSAQTVFGKLVRSEDGLSATIAEDMNGGKGTSDLIVSFGVPLSVLSGHPSKVEVALQLPPTASNTLFLDSTSLGNFIFETVLSNLGEVAVFRNPPNISCHRPVIDLSPPPSSHLPKGSDVEISNVLVHFDNEGRVEKFKIHVDILPETSEDKGSFNLGGVSVIQVSPCALAILIPGRGDHVVAFPYPVDVSRAKLEYFTGLSWFFTPFIELLVPPSRPTDKAGFNPFMLPTVNGEPPIVWNMPRVNLDRLPVLNTESYGNTNEWLPIHLTCMYSDAERLVRDQGEITNLKSNLKDSLASILLNASGNVTLGQKTRVFAITSPNQDNFQILIFIANIRLDLGSRTIVADARVLPLTESIARSEVRALAALNDKGIMQMIVDDAELECWEDILPALVERCRNWKHAASCEYRTQGIPASEVEGESPLCSCGVGKAPQIFEEVEEWKPFEKYWTRAAIAPIFAFPYAESSSMALEDLKNFKGALRPSEQMKGRRILGADRNPPIAERETIKKDGKILRVMAKASSVGEKATSVTSTVRPPVDASICQNCKRKPQTGLRACKGCGEVYYCSVDCQKKDWRRHKSVCKK